MLKKLLKTLMWLALLGMPFVVGAVMMGPEAFTQWIKPRIITVAIDVIAASVLIVLLGPGAWQVVPARHEAGVFRMRQLQKYTLQPGLYWKLSFADRIVPVSRYDYPIEQNDPNPSATRGDETNPPIDALVSWLATVRIDDVLKLLNRIPVDVDPDDAIAQQLDAIVESILPTVGFIHEVTSGGAPVISRKVLARTRADDSVLRRWGVEVVNFTATDITPAENYMAKMLKMFEAKQEERVELEMKQAKREALQNDFLPTEAIQAYEKAAENPNATIIQGGVGDFITSFLGNIGKRGNN